MKNHEIDQKIGINYYSTEDKGIGGILRKRLSDFKVREIDLNENVLPFFTYHKNYFHLKNKKIDFLEFYLQKVGLSTFDAIRKISKLTKINQNNFDFSGLKDKRGITVQNVSVEGNVINKLLELNEKDIIIYNIKKGKKVYRGNHWGNHFKIIIREILIPKNDCNILINSIWNKIHKNGLLNYFGYQRFGTIRPITHLIGKEILRNQYELAIKKYLTFASNHENQDISNLRQIIIKDWPNIDNDIIKKIPDNLFFEKRLLEECKFSNLDYFNILISVFKPNLIRLFIHAYQSYLFNKLLSQRSDIIGKKIIHGDFIIILDYSGLPSRKIIQIKENNVNLGNKLVNNHKAVLGIPLLGKDYINNNKIISHYNFKSILKEEKIILESFNFKDHPDMEINGGFRAAYIYPKGFKFKILKNIFDNKIGYCCDLSFSLQKGSYATIFLREFMKSNPLNY